MVSGRHVADEGCASVRGLLARAGRAAIAAVSIALVTPVMADSPTLPKAWTELAGKFDATLAKDRMVGGSLALVENGLIVARRDYGYADKGKGRRVDENTIFHWASITKTLNGITVMQLRDQGRLTLDEPITKYVPELRRMHNPFGSMDAITIRMLLNHSAGFQAGTWPYRRGVDWEPFEPTEWAQLVAMMPYQQIEFAPGSKSSYSNPAWIYLARALEDLTGDSWEYYVQKNIFMPLGMTRSYFGHTPTHLRSQRSSRYIVTKGEDGQIVEQDLGGEFDPGITIPNGGWNAPLADVAAYIAFLTNATRGDAKLQERYDSVLRRDSLREMWQPQFPAAMWDKTEQIGLSFFITERGGRRVIGHTGSQGGFVTFFYCDPETGRGIIGALNTGNGARPEGQPTAFSVIRSEALNVFER